MGDSRPLNPIGNWLKQLRLPMKSMVLLAVFVVFIALIIPTISGHYRIEISEEIIPFEEPEPITQEELNSDVSCSLVAERNVRNLRERGYMATKVIVENHAGNPHALTGVTLLFETDGHLLTPEEFNAYYKFRYRELVDGRLWGVYENQVWDTIEDSENFECECGRRI